MVFFLVTKGATSEAEWIARLTLVTERLGLRVQDGASWLDVLLGLEL
jgi:hypothetical protein